MINNDPFMLSSSKHVPIDRADHISAADLSQA